MATIDPSDESLKEEDSIGLGCALEYFSEHEEIFEMINSLKDIVDSDSNKIENAYEKFNFILSQYIEQPHLIDSHLDLILEKFINIVRSDESSMSLKHLAFKFMFVVVNVRGYKMIVRHLPHEVADFEPVLQLLENQDLNDPETWTTRYILLLWLSIIVIIPFHMSRFDGSDDTVGGKKSVMDRVLDIIKTYAIVSDKCRDGAAFLAHKFITRTDVKEKHLSSFLDWAKELSLTEDNNVFIKYGTLTCIAALLKHGKRDDLLPYARNLLEWIINADFKNNFGSNIKKLVYKIIQRIGLTFLPPRIASWRYKRGNRSLTANLSSGDGSGSSVPIDCKEENTIEEEIDVPDEIEDVIDQLIEGLKCKDGVVRWSAAKGIGRVTGRLPKESADDVVGSILDTFSPRETDSAWHGSCLALAELGRRGLLLPDRLPQVIPVIMKALVYDEPKGFSSVGSHIRDAACYVCWSFPRAYDSAVLAPFVPTIASYLLIVLCYDKEINCRRAASAAFQELVGRQDNVPHGIQILQECNSYSVSSRSDTYLKISVSVAEFLEYQKPLLDHLIYSKVDHWDASIRKITSKALHMIAPTCHSSTGISVLPILFNKTNSIDLNCRHGAVLAIGEILHGFSKRFGVFLPNHSEIADDTLTKIKNLIKFYREKLYFKGMGGELMRQACCHFIGKCALAGIPLHDDDDTVDNWFDFVTECLSHEVAAVRAEAVKAIPQLLTQYYKNRINKHKYIVDKFTKEMLSHNEYARMGFSLALGSLPEFLLFINIHDLVDSLINACKITTDTVKWAECRREAVKALTLVIEKMGYLPSNNEGITSDDIFAIAYALLNGLEDYTQDKRGDIGAWVREASMQGLHTLTDKLAVVRPQCLDDILLDKILSEVAQQAVEKIDRTRAVAGKVFYGIIHENPLHQNISHIHDLHRIFPKEECENMIWNSASSTFPKFVQLLEIPLYRYNVTLGFICSIGGMTENLVKNASSSFFAFLKSKSDIDDVSHIREICTIVQQIFLENKKIDRITVAMLRFLDKFFDSGCIDFMLKVTESEFFQKIFKLTQGEISGCNDIYKIADSINVFCQLVQIKGEVCDKALSQLSILLCYRTPYIRRNTANRLYEFLLVKGDETNINPKNLDEIMNILSTTDWEQSLEVIRPLRNKLCTLIGIRIPMRVTKLITK